jgi:hypothetical protein
MGMNMASISTRADAETASIQDSLSEAAFIVPL